MSGIENIPSSFRDPSGNLFLYNGILHRRISYSYKDNYDHLINSGLYDALYGNGYIVEHEEVRLDELSLIDAYKIIKLTPDVNRGYENIFMPHPLT